MDDYQRALMDCPSVPRQPYCPVCGRAGKLTEHHVVPRSQGGHKGPTIYLCGDGTTGCHGLAEDNRLHFCYEDGFLTNDDPGWLWVLLDEATKIDDPWQVAGWQRLSIYDEQRDEVPFEYDDLLGDLAQEIRDLKCSADQIDYFLSRELAEAERKLRGDRKALSEWCIDNLDISPRSVDSYLSKRIAYASLPESCSTLGITNGYKLFLLSQSHPLDEVLRDYGSMSRSQFNETYGLTKTKPKHECPVCHVMHADKGERDDGA